MKLSTFLSNLNDGLLRGVSNWLDRGLKSDLLTCAARLRIRGQDEYADVIIKIADNNY